MDSSRLPFPGLLGPGRLARWRRAVLRRLLAAVCAALAVTSMVQTLRPTEAPSAATRPVLLAARSVPSGTVLTAGDLTVARLPAVAAPPGSYADATPALGRMTSAPLAAGEPLTATRLVPRGPADGLAAGLTAVHVAVADPGVLALVAPGQRVLLHSPGGTVLARDVLVLAVDPPHTSPAGATSESRGVVVALPAKASAVVTSSLVSAGSPVGLGLSVLPTR